MKIAARVAAALQARRRRFGALLRRLALAADPTPARVARRIGVHPSEGVLGCVYRREHVERVGALVTAASEAGLEPRLWALDELAPTLQPWTLGCGSGWRQELLNRLVSEDFDGWVVLADDDVTVPDGALAQLLTIATRLGFDVVQPAHDGGSRASTPFVRARRGVAARRTGFVEIGPLVALGPTARASLLPLDESLGMGWGQDYLWARVLATDGLAGGIVDAVRMRHLPPTTRTYDHAEATQHLERCLARAGYRSYGDPMITYATWRAGELT